jgi:hypothetical protein
MTSRDELAAAPERLVRALVAGAGPPPGFDAVRLEAAARALLHKRAGEVARSWPGLAAAYGARWSSVFAGWAAGRPSRGSWLDGWDFARAHRASLAYDGVVELAGCEVNWSRRAGGHPVRRRVALRRIPGGVVVQVLGRTKAINRSPAQDPR